MATPLRVLLIGAEGRMGQAIRAIADAKEFAIGGIDRGDEVGSAMRECDVAIDFSHADAAPEICAAAMAHQRPLIIGTTGHSTEQRAAIHRAAKQLPVVLASNFSVGVNVLFELTRRAAELLSDFDVEVLEAHHRMKRDAPSGTAKSLVDVLCAVRANAKLLHGREGNVGARTAKEIGIHSVRGGDIVGDHTVVFAGAGERIELTHRATSRETFARGALVAARWIVGKPAGLYDMRDVLQLT